ncbi:2-hydroxyacid dehydrogenase [Celerinatantimonas diazotrophica]|uniref:Glyoxylate/hydroxypyruvate reductase B n=1 Tax=Celerinatantimonas diazotrophica TaxID=412034 RepID=A0A4R1J8I4_9GAMM|nr:D-glycerate dehydrogenase [Celerinatantimonas diazotrophica]TCK46893.1 gluconate 2-dehydrogenase [Celerinatantimonas diazotrophica]CAG9295660.1 Glyoxylate/hydroxypyruvate reductase B [Celerinatantimonas diazotrophica]
MKSTVAVFAKISDTHKQVLEQYFNVLYVNHIDELSEEKCQEIQGVLASGGFTLGEEQLAKLPKLKAASTVSVGYDSYDIDALTNRQVILTHTPGVLDETVADTVFALMLSSARRVVELATWVRSGQWHRSLSDQYFGRDVHHKTIGIVGMGRIGMAVARRAHLGFGMPVLYHNRHPKEIAQEQFAAQLVALDELFARADFIVMLTPLTEQTYHLIGTQQFEKMKPSAVFINASRGDVVDEQALIDALEGGKIAAAGLDVFHQEPIDPDSKLLSMPQVVALPHIGSATTQTREAMAELAVNSLVDALVHKNVHHCVNPSAWSL